MEIHRADPSYRNRTVLLLAFTVLLCVVLLLLLDAWLGRVNSQLTGSDPETVRRWLQGLLAGLGIALAVPAGLLGVGLQRLGLASPPQAWKTLRDVRVLRDADALRWAHRTELAGLAAIALAVLLVAWAGWAWLRFG